MSWILEGKRVKGRYLGDSSMEVAGMVMESRVAYGGTVKHHVVLDKPLVLSFSSTPRVSVILDGCHVDEVEE